MAVLLIWKFGLSFELPFYVVFSYFLIVIAFIDLETQLIHNRVLVAMLIMGILLNFVFQVIPWLESAFGIAAGGGSMLLFAWAGQKLFKKEAMGMGDVKFSAVAGLFLGWKIILVALYAGFVLAMLTVLLLRLLNKLNLSARIPLGPFLASGLLLFVLFGEQLTMLYVSMIMY
jgi:leader peptidase (prepilin peptidase)/N-methyltransferase